MSDLDVVVWDMGGIFQSYFTEVVLELGREQGWPVDTMPLGPTGPVPDPEYVAMAEGRISESDYYQHVVARLRAAGVDYEPQAEHDGQRRRRVQVWALIDELAASPVRQAILTNDASTWLGERWWETWQHRHLFDAIVDVATLGVRKPDPLTYRRVLAELDVDPASAIFVDDMPVNCRGAEEVGMQSQFFDIADPAGSVESLRARLGVSVR